MLAVWTTEGEVPLRTSDGLRCLATALGRAGSSGGQQFVGCDCRWPSTPW